MQTIPRNRLTKLTTAFLLVTAMFSGLTPAAAYAASCTADTFRDLWTKTGTAILYTGGPTVNIWGYSDTELGDAVLPGPVLDVNQGNCVQVTLHNGLSEPSALLFQGQSLIPDTTGAAAGGIQVYTFAASNPGTFLYEAGLTPNGQHQVAMGMYGALVVRPTGAPSQAYASPSTAFDTEQVLVLSEYDTTLALNPTGFDIRNYKPKYFLINGKAYPGTASIFADAGADVLLRYVNAGLTSHHMGILGLSQTVIGQDGNPFAFPHKVVSETVAPGQTLDALVTIPTALSGTKYALYDSNLMLRNNTGLTTYAGFGGMLTFLTVGAGGPPPPVDTGPFVTLPGLSPNPTGGSSPAPVTVTATISDAGTLTVNNITAAEFYIDSTAGTAYPMSADNAPFDGPTESVTSTLPISTVMLQALASGNHTIYIRGRDSASNWSSFLPFTLNLDKTGPTSTTLALSPNPSSGAVNVSLTATGNDTASGNSNVTAAEYWVDAVGTPANGSGTAMTTLGSPSPTRSLSTTISSGLAQGTHVVSAHSQDSFGNWGAISTINLVVTDTVPPTTSGVTASPNPNNGLMPFNTTVQAVRVTASFSDVASGGSNIAAAEGFIDTIGATGTGFAFSATDGTFNSSSENGYADIPLAVVNALASGNHTIYVHAKDAAGNWNNILPYASTVLTINRSLYFSTLGNTNPPGAGGTADDADIYLWNGTAFSRSIDVSAAPYGIPSGANVDGFDRVDATHFYMSFNGSVTLTGPGTVQDEDIVYYNTGTWSLYFDGTPTSRGLSGSDLDAISIVGTTLYFSTDDSDIPTGVSGSGDDADIYSWNGTSMARVYDASVLLWSTANVDGFVWVDSTHFYLSYSVDTTVPGLGTVQDEDVVYYNNGAWLIYFDGTAKGLTAANQDIDAFDVP